MEMEDRGWRGIEGEYITEIVFFVKESFFLGGGVLEVWYKRGTGGRGSGGGVRVIGVGEIDRKSRVDESRERGGRGFFGGVLIRAAGGGGGGEVRGKRGVRI